MNKITTTLISALALVATTAPQALAESRRSNYGLHVRLGRVVRSTGIDYKINPKACWQKEGVMGYYWAYKNEFVVCQEGKQQVGVEEVWSEEDLDTLRHEAQHLVQDCMDGERQGALSAVYKDVPALVKNTLSDRAIKGIIKAYSEKSDHIIMMELEAFSVAAINDPADQARDIQNFCF